MRDFYSLLALCALPLISRGKPAFRGNLQPLSLTNANGDQPSVSYLKYQHYIEKNEELLQKIETLSTLPDGMRFLQWDWKAANEELGDMKQWYLLDDNDLRLRESQQKATEYRLGLLLILGKIDDPDEIDTTETPQVLALMKKRAKEAGKLQLIPKHMLLDQGNALRIAAAKDPDSLSVQALKDVLQEKMEEYDGLKEAFGDLFTDPELGDTDPKTNEFRNQLESIYHLQGGKAGLAIQKQKEQLRKIWEAGMSTKDQVAYFAKLVRVEQRLEPESSKLLAMQQELEEMLQPYQDLQAAFVDLIELASPSPVAAMSGEAPRRRMRNWCKKLKNRLSHHLPRASTVASIHI